MKNAVIEKKKMVNLISLGCAKNLVDSEVSLRRFEANQYGNNKKS